MQRSAIVDLGSNTARLVVYAHEPGKWYRLIDEIREPIRLGAGVQPEAGLDEAAIDRALAALKLYSDYARATSLESIDVVATSAVRDAANRETLLSEVRELGLTVSVLDGEEEARLGVTAVANGFALRDAWVVDLGGGSAQISHMVDRDAVDCRSFPLGAVRLTETWLLGDPPKTSEIESLERAVVQQLAPLVDILRASEHPIVAMGGTVRNLARTIQKTQQYPLPLLHNYFLSRAALDELTERLAGLRTRKRARIPGMHPDRADVILAGALVFRRLLHVSGRDGLWIAGQGIREGAFFERFLPAPHRVPDVGKFAVQNLFERHAQPRRHTQRVRKLARSLFAGLASLHGWGEREAELLDAAAVLHDIGKTINHYDHDHHGEYLVESAPLAGFSHVEQALIALLVRYHRKGSPSPGRFKRLFQRDDRRRLLDLAVCLRLAEKLERSRAGRVRDVEVEIRKKSVRVTLLAAEPPFVELWEARKQTGFFERVYGRKLKLEALGDEKEKAPASGDSIAGESRSRQ
ncbi:MAG: Ppx/GppA family phosphatase [bacterium]|nr:Ppx/GppA family phosphatase [bacterium]